MNQTGRILEEVKKAVCGKDRVLVWVLTVLLVDIIVVVVHDVLVEH